jgi:hypothetical protein
MHHLAGRSGLDFSTFPGNQRREIHVWLPKCSGVRTTLCFWDFWLLQEITTRLPGRIAAVETTFGSQADLASALRRAEAAHGEHEKRTGQRDANWPDWYAAYR